jgi:hypothetical protein
MGYGGNGITFSQIASEIVSTTIGGAEDADSKLFAFGRSGILRKLVDLSGQGDGLIGNGQSVWLGKRGKGVSP